MSEYAERDLTPGAAQGTRPNGIFVNLRAGVIARTTNQDMTGQPGWYPYENENASGTKYKFWGYPYDDLIGYVKNIKWYEHKFDDGSMSRSWWIILDVQDQEFILDLKSTDRPFSQTMSTLLALDFNKPVKFVGFMGKNKKTQKPQKVLLINQGKYDPDSNKDVWEQAAYRDKWLSLELVQKIREKKITNEPAAKEHLSETEYGNLAFNADGSINREYPYIKQNEDKSWNFTDWNNFLMRKMKEEVIPNVEAAQALRDQGRREEIASQDQTPEFSGPDQTSASVAPAADDEIPF